MGRFRPNDRYDRESMCDLSWEQLYGTTASGNLPQFVKNHIGKCYAPCPFSTQAIFDINELPIGYTQTFGEVDIYLKSRSMLGYVPSTFVDHTTPEGMVVLLQPHYSGVWGHICMYDGCPYYLETGKRYFYI